MWNNVLNNIAVIYNAIGEKAKAIKIYNSILKVKNDNIVTLINYAGLLVEDKEYSAAQELLEKAFEIATKIHNDIEVFNVLIDFCNFYNNCNNTQKSIDII